MYPSILLNVRSGFPAHLLAFLLFWIAVALALAYGRTGRAGLLYALGVTAVLCVLNPYPPLLALPVLVLGLLLWRPGLRSLVRTPAFFGVAGLVAGLSLGAHAALAYRIGYPLKIYRQTVSAFARSRGGFSLVNLSLADIPRRFSRFDASSGTGPLVLLMKCLSRRGRVVLTCRFTMPWR